MDYKKLIDDLIKREDDCFQLTYSQIEDILGAQLPKSLIKYGGITQKSEIGKAILSADFLFKNSYKQKIIMFTKDKQGALENLENIDVESTEKKINIFLNVVFPHSAEYVNSKGNIGHEIIDIFGGDNGEYHYYLNPRGLVDEANVPNVIISICHASTGLYKILNKAIIDKPEKHSTKKENTAGNVYTKQKRKFSYNGKFLEDYFETNPGGNTVLSSFACKGIYEPTKPLYIAFKTFKQDRLKMVSTTPGRTTFFINFNQKDQDLLESIVSDDSLWNKNPIKSFKQYADEYEQSNNFNYFKELGIEKQELQYSNAIRFFLEHYGLTNTFLERLGCNIGKKETFLIEREKYNIDLFFTNFNTLNESDDNSQERIVIIENKIKANVTPSDNDKTLKEQVEKVFRYVYEIDEVDELKQEQKQEVDCICNGLGISDSTTEIPSQLSKYYIYAFILAKKRKWSAQKIEKDIMCFFLCPEYSRVLYEVTDSGFLTKNTFIGENEVLFLQGKYKLKTYKDILPVFQNCLAKEPKGKHWYFLEDFIDSIKTQSKDRDDTLEQTMIKMFYSRSKTNKRN